MDIAPGSLVLQAVRQAYDLWKESRTESLALSDGAKAVLGRMQSDSTNNGVFVDSTSLADSDLLLDMSIQRWHRNQNNAPRDS